MDEILTSQKTDSPAGQQHTTDNSPDAAGMWDRWMECCWDENDVWMAVKGRGP